MRLERKHWLMLLMGAILAILLLRAFAAGDLEIEETALTYRPEIEPLVVAELIRLRNQNNGFIDPVQEWEAYRAVYQRSGGTDTDLKTWTPHSDIAPKLMRVRVRVKNTGIDPSSPAPVQMTVSAKVGTRVLNSATLLLDEEQLAQTAAWQPVATVTGTIPVLARQETYDFFSEPVAFGPFLLSLQHQAPVQLRVHTVLSGSGQSSQIDIPVEPDPMAPEDLED